MLLLLLFDPKGSAVAMVPSLLPVSDPLGAKNSSSNFYVTKMVSKYTTIDKVYFAF